MHCNEVNQKLYVFDCDGVLVDTNTSKLDFVKMVLSDLNMPGDFVLWAVENFRQNFGRTRLNHFQNFERYAAGCNIPLPQDFVQLAIANYSILAKELYSKCDIIKESQQFIKNLITDNVFVVSASDQAELRDVLPARYVGIGKEHIFGGPASKVHNLQQLKSAHPERDIKFFGDSHLDALAAAEAGVEFTGVCKFSAAPDLLIAECRRLSFRFVPTMRQVHPS